MKALFITGGTGFVGGALACRMLERGDGQRMTFLVRAPDRRQGLNRLRASLRRFELPEPVLATLDAEQIVCGDLADPSPWLDDSRVTRATHILNSGASTAFTQERLAWSVNHFGSLRFARAAVSFPRLVRFVHVGTAMSCGPERDKLVTELWESPPADRHLVAYTASKAAFEIAARTQLPDLPLVVARPSIVLGDTQLGCRASSSIFWILRAARAIGGFSCDLDDRIDIVPVDWVALALDRLLTKDRLGHDVYHLSAGSDRCVTFREIDIAHAASLDEEPMGAGYHRHDYRSLARAVRLSIPALSSLDMRLVAKALALYGEFANLGYAFANSRILAEGVPPPPRLTDYLALCVTSAASVPLSDQVRFDVKGAEPRRPVSEAAAVAA